MMQHTLLCLSKPDSSYSYLCIGCSFNTNFARPMEKHLVRLIARKTCGESVSGHIEVIEKKQLNNPKLKQVCLTPVSSNYTTVLMFPKKIKSDSLVDTDMFVCSLCQYVTRFKSNLKRHMKILHKASIHHGGNMVVAGSKLEPIPFKERPALMRDKEGLYVCSRCNYRTRFSNNIRRHTNQHHDGDRTFVCLECEFQTHSGYLLNSHMKNKHKDKEYPTGIDVEDLEDVIVIRK
uniref:C2H2-type domain-containing protein n=1 Tax=Cacopsylla melanoneura TaxID=428564 RepID=A0A8D8VMD9_9HEMI